MEKAPIKKFAVEARRKLIADVTFQLERYGITEKGIVEPQTSTDKELVFDLGSGNIQTIRGERAVNQYKNLAAHVRGFYTNDEPKKELEQFIEEIAYTWFNRLIAIRFMEVNRYLPVRVLSSEITGQKLPDLVKAPFSGDLEFTEDEKQRIFDLQDANKEDDLFRFLFFKQCNDLSRILPRLFENLDGSNSFSELLIVLSFNDPNGVVYRLVNEVDERWFDIHATDEDGKPLEWEVRCISSREDETLRRDCQYRVQVPGKRGSFRQEFDNVLYLAKLAAACTVYPNLNDAELQDSYGTKCAEELISAMLTPGEYTNYTEKLFDICGFGDKLDLVEQAKN